MQMSEKSSPSLRILIVDDEPNIRKTLSIGLEADGHQVVAVSNAQDAMVEAARQSFDIAFVDLRLGATSGSDLIPDLLAQSPWMRVVIITAHGTIDSAVTAMKQGAADYLTKPFTPGQVKLIVQRIAQLRALEQQVAGLEGVLGTSDREINLKSHSPAMQRVVKLAHQVADSDSTVLICGESGTGKGLLAKAIHFWSRRAKSPFAVVSCPTLSPQLLESELFGHAKGAFTGAVRDNPGRIASCDGGTIFLDEIGDLPLNLQPKLLRFVQDREYERVGEARTRRADVRVIAATNVNLDQAVRAGHFREDLLYRIKVVELDLPPLRERAEDIADLAEQFLGELRKGRHVVGFTTEALAALGNYQWPGNIRELRNVIERSLILCQGDRVTLQDLAGTLTPSAAAAPHSVEPGDDISLDALEEMHIRRVLAKSRSLEQAAETLGIDAATLWRRRKKYGI